MLTRIKVFGKSVLKALNALVGLLLPVVNTRGGDTISGAAQTTLAPKLAIKGSPKMYYANAKGGTPYWVGIFERGLLLPPLVLFKLYNANMVNRGVVLYQNKVLLESAIFQREYLNKLLANGSILTSLFKKPKARLGKVMPLLNKLSNNYFHWTAESLTRLAAISAKGNEDYHQYHIIIAADAPSFVRDSLMLLFKIQPDKIIAWKNNDASRLGECLLVSYPFVRTPQTAMTNVYYFPLFKLLNTISLRNIPTVSQEPTYVIVSRGHAKQRRLVGEEKIVEAFPTIPFKIVYIEKMAFAEQVTTFRHAKIIIAPHGAGLVNLVYVTQQPVVIEIFPSTRKIRDASLFLQVSREMGIEYHLLVKEPVNSNQDIEVNEALLLEINNIIALYKF